jgi:hypothetical protein
MDRYAARLDNAVQTADAARCGQMTSAMIWPLKGQRCDLG